MEDLLIAWIMPAGDVQVLQLRFACQVRIMAGLKLGVTEGAVWVMLVLVLDPAITSIGAMVSMPLKAMMPTTPPPWMGDALHT